MIVQTLIWLKQHQRLPGQFYQYALGLPFGDTEAVGVDDEK